MMPWFWAQHFYVLCYWLLALLCSVEENPFGRLHRECKSMRNGAQRYHDGLGGGERCQVCEGIQERGACNCA